MPLSPTRLNARKEDVTPYQCCKDGPQSSIFKKSLKSATLSSSSMNILEMYNLHCCMPPPHWSLSSSSCWVPWCEIIIWVYGTLTKGSLKITRVGSQTLISEERNMSRENPPPHPNLFWLWCREYTWFWFCGTTGHITSVLTRSAEFVLLPVGPLPSESLQIPRIPWGGFEWFWIVRVFLSLEERYSSRPGYLFESCWCMIFSCH